MGSIFLHMVDGEIWEKKRNLHMFFIDLEKANDIKVPRGHKKKKIVDILMTLMTCMIEQ